MRSRDGLPPGSGNEAYDFLRLHPTTQPRHREGQVSVYADETGALKQIDPDGVESDLGGGGGSQLITRSIYGLAAASAPDATDTDLAWSLQQGDALLDLADAENPLPLVSGVYAVTIRATPFAVISATAVFQVFGDIDDDNLSPIFTNYGPMRAFASVGASCTFYCPNNSAIRAWVNHDDTGQSPQVGGQAFVQRIS